MEFSNSDTTSIKTPLLQRPVFYLKVVFAILLFAFTALLFSVVLLRWVNPPTTSFMLQQNWEELQVETYSLRDHWVDYESLPKHSAWAVVASEDQLFWQHWGFDFESIQEAWEERQEGARSRGASSITQQVAKNIFLWPAESFFRKGVEAGITLLIELFWSKDRIIEVYLNISEFGPGVFGIGVASEHFFDLNASQLEPDMTARLAAVLPNPKRMRVNPPSPYAKERSRWILKQMTQLSGIQYARSQSVNPIDRKPSDFPTGSDSLITRQAINSESLNTDYLSPDSTAKIKANIDSSMADTNIKTKPSTTDSLAFPATASPRSDERPVAFDSTGLD